MARIYVALDAMGGDNAPEAAVAGAIGAMRADEEICIRFFGQAERLRPLLAGAEELAERWELLDAREVISMHDAPMLAVRRKADSSLVRAALDVKEGHAGAMVSAGSTGAVLAAGILRVGRIPGIERPALAPVLPGKQKPFLLIDCGANVDCQAKYLNQFGLMGSVYMEKILGVKQPEVRLLNIGSEAEKGNRLSQEAYGLMRAQSAYRFCGNVEAREVPLGTADVVVADGFDGNLILKYTEGLSSALVGMLKAEMLSSFRGKLGALLLKPALKMFKGRLDYEQYGGAPLLGVKGGLIKAHGSSNDKAMRSAILQAAEMIRQDVSGRIAEGLAQIEPAGE